MRSCDTASEPAKTLKSKEYGVADPDNKAIKLFLYREYRSCIANMEYSAFILCHVLYLESTGSSENAGNKEKIDII